MQLYSRRFNRCVMPLCTPSATFRSQLFVRERTYRYRWHGGRSLPTGTRRQLDKKQGIGRSDPSAGQNSIYCLTGRGAQRPCSRSSGCTVCPTLLPVILSGSTTFFTNASESPRFLNVLQCQCLQRPAQPSPAACAPSQPSAALSRA